MRTTINYTAKRRLGISLAEYAICDIISKLASIPEANGWCRMSRTEMAAFAGLSRRGLIYMIDRLVALGMVEKNDEGGLRTTQLWNDVVSMIGK